MTNSDLVSRKILSVELRGRLLAVLSCRAQ